MGVTSAGQQGCRLEDLQVGAVVVGVLADASVTVVAAKWSGRDAVWLTFRDSDGRVDQTLLYRADEARLSMAAPESGTAFDGNADHFRLAAEALRIRMAAADEAMLAVATSRLRPLPHQIQAVYGELLPRRPLRFLLADDPGAGKTIMAGLYIKELALRGDLERCLIIAPGGLVDQWQDELLEKFGLSFDLLTKQLTESTIDGNVFDKYPLLIARMDALSRSDDLRAKLAESEWDLVVVDEAHRMSAHYYGAEVKSTKRYELGMQLGEIARHLLLMTATPHAGKQEDFDLFMQLLDNDQFEGKHRSEVHSQGSMGLMRRMIKEDLKTFDGKDLFPERRAYTVEYELSPIEQELYEDVTVYVREEMNRAERAGGQKGNMVGFALTVLQRRLASSPEAILKSLERRRKRLEAKRAAVVSGVVQESELAPAGLFARDQEDLEAALDDLSGDEVEGLEDEVVDAATTASTLSELDHEITVLNGLEQLAFRVRHSGDDRKWRELSELLQTSAEMVDVDGTPRKLIVFTEHRDTLEYLVGQIRNLLGKPGAVEAIHGGTPRERRRAIRDQFTQDPELKVLVATDAAGEGLNLQRAHLMVNYDLPWNPNRIEQRFGRIHRIGQTEVCHLWNLVAIDTREGEVFKKLLDKIEEQRKAYSGKVFNVLGEAFEGAPLRTLLLDAIRYGDDPQVRARRDEIIDARVGDGMRELIEKHAAYAKMLSAADVEAIRLRMEEAQARRLHPYYVQAFFAEAFKVAGGRLSPREAGRFEITHVPQQIRRREKRTALGGLIGARIERVCFDLGRTEEPGKANAELLAPGHPLFEAVLDQIIETHQDLLKRGTILIDAADAGIHPRLMVALTQEVIDGHRRSVDRTFAFAELLEQSEARAAGPAPYLDYRAPSPRELEYAKSLVGAPWLGSGAEQVAMDWAIQQSVPEHLSRVRERVVPVVGRTTVQVKERLGQEIMFWNGKAAELTLAQHEGRKTKRRPEWAEKQAEDLELRRAKRLAELQKDAALSPRPPLIAGLALIVPIGLVTQLAKDAGDELELDYYASDGAETDRRAIAAVINAERALGRRPEEMVHNNPGYDIRSLTPDGHLIHIEVKGRKVGAHEFYVTRNEVLTSKNAADRHRLALVAVSDDGADHDEIRYLVDAFARTEFGDLKAEGLILDWPDTWNRGGAPK